MKKLLLAILISIFGFGCWPLRKSDISEVNAYEIQVGQTKFYYHSTSVKVPTINWNDETLVFDGLKAADAGNKYLTVNLGKFDYSTSAKDDINYIIRYMNNLV